MDRKEEIDSNIVIVGDLNTIEINGQGEFLSLKKFIDSMQLLSKYQWCVSQNQDKYSKNLYGNKKD